MAMLNNQMVYMNIWNIDYNLLETLFYNGSVWRENNTRNLWNPPKKFLGKSDGFL